MRLDKITGGLKRVLFVALKSVVRASQNTPQAFRRWLAAQIAKQIAQRCEVISHGQAGSGDGEAVVLVINAYRLRSELEQIKGHGRLKLISAPTFLLQAINSMFETRGPHDENTIYRYFLERDPRALRERAALIDLAKLVLVELRKRLEFSAILSASLFYEYEVPWAQACADLGISFVGIHKEFTVLDGVHVDFTIDYFKEFGTKFLGTHALVVSETAKKVLSEGAVVDAERVQIVGLPRMDRLFDRAASAPCTGKKKPRLTFFSFAHYSGNLIPTERRSKLFSKWDHEGFVELFRDVHVAAAEVALERPDAEILIKPKNVVGWWVREIEAVIRDALGVELNEIGNCNIVDKNAVHLIETSQAIVGFNSTVLIEATILGKGSIVPVFAEAATKYPENIYMQDYYDCLTVARSKDELKAAMLRALDEKEPTLDIDPVRRSDFIRRYLGYDDSGCTARVVDAIEAAALKGARAADTTP